MEVARKGANLRCKASSCVLCGDVVLKPLAQLQVKRTLSDAPLLWLVKANEAVPQIRVSLSVHYQS